MSYSQVGRKEEWSRGLNELPVVGGSADLIRKWDSGVVSYLSDGKYGAQPLTLHQRGYDGARIGYTDSVNQNANKYTGDVNQANRTTGDQMAAMSMQQGRESAGAAYGAAGTAIAGHKSALGLSDQATRVEFTGRVASAEITRTAAVDSAKLQAISMIISRMGAKIAQDIEKGVEMRY